MNSCFSLVRPLIEFSADQIMQRTNNVFVFQALVPSSKIHKERAVELSSATTKVISCFKHTSVSRKCLGRNFYAHLDFPKIFGKKFYTYLKCAEWRCSTICAKRFFLFF